MNREEQRFHAAVAAMQTLVGAFHSDRDTATAFEKLAKEKGKFTAEALIESCTHYADALLAELDRTTVKQPLTVQPDDDDAKEITVLMQGMELAWGVIANAHGGDWNRANVEWLEAAKKWRDEEWHPALSRNGYAGTKGGPFCPRPKPQPDAEGWITHVPGDPMPCDGEMEVRIRCADGYECGDTAEFWSGSHDGIDLWTGRGADRDAQIIAWKPA